MNNNELGLTLRRLAVRARNIMSNVIDTFADITPNEEIEVCGEAYDWLTDYENAVGENPVPVEALNDEPYTLTVCFTMTGSVESILEYIIDPTNMDDIKKAIAEEVGTMDEDEASTAVIYAYVVDKDGKTHDISPSEA